MINCCTSTIPKSKKYRNTQFSTVKKRSGKESIPFLGLESGIHTVNFYNEKESMVMIVKTWLSPYGYAWKVVNNKDARNSALIIDEGVEL